MNSGQVMLRAASRNVSFAALAFASAAVREWLRAWKVSRVRSGRASQISAQS